MLIGTKKNDLRFKNFKYLKERVLVLKSQIWYKSIVTLSVLMCKLSDCNFSNFWEQMVLSVNWFHFVMWELYHNAQTKVLKTNWFFFKVYILWFFQYIFKLEHVFIKLFLHKAVHLKKKIYLILFNVQFFILNELFDVFTFLCVWNMLQMNVSAALVKQIRIVCNVIGRKVFLRCL